MRVECLDSCQGSHFGEMTASKENDHGGMRPFPHNDTTRTKDEFFLYWETEVTGMAPSACSKFSSVLLAPIDETLVYMLSWCLPIAFLCT